MLHWRGIRDIGERTIRRYQDIPSFLTSLFFSPPLFLVEVRFPVTEELVVVELRAAAPRDFLVEHGAAAVFPCFSSPEETGPLVGESGESEVLIRFESCFGLPPQHQPSRPAFEMLLFRCGSENSLVGSLAGASFAASRACSSRRTSGRFVVFALFEHLLQKGIIIFGITGVHSSPPFVRLLLAIDW
jgi:hypothetical protein